MDWGRGISESAVVVAKIVGVQKKSVRTTCEAFILAIDRVVVVVATTGVNWSAFIIRQDRLTGAVSDNP